MYLHDEILVPQPIYKSEAIKSQKSFSYYLIDDHIWIETRNILIARTTVKLNDQNIGLYLFAKVFPKKSLVVQLNLPNLL